MNNLPDFKRYLYSKRSHFVELECYSDKLYSKQVSVAESRLKIYQDLFVAMFFDKFIPPGSKVLEVGGGCSRILPIYTMEYECWNIDSFEGLGNGPKSVVNMP